MQTNNDIKVSVIIPFYNVEDYIGECLESVLAQSLPGIEIILINDASTDNSRKIAQNYADKDSRIKIIDLANRSGQGFARNRGIEAAQGEYIGFVDSDDFVEKDMFKLLYNKAKNDDLDIAMCQVKEYDDMNNEYSTSDYYALTCLTEFGDKIFSAEETKEQLLDINIALWNKIYKREYLLNTGEKFPEGFIYEDLPFFFGTYTPAKRIGIIWKSLYNYRVNRKNSTMQQFNNKILDRPPMVSLTYEKLKKLPYFSEIENKVKGWVIDDLFHRYVLLKENYHQEFFFLMKRIFQRLEIDNPKDECWRKLYYFKGYQMVVDNTFDEFNKKIFNIYVDFRELENLFESKTMTAPELFKRFEIVDNYIKETATWMARYTDDKMNKLYDEIHKNYEYTNKQDDEIKAFIQPIYEHIDSKFEELKDFVQNTYKNTSLRIESLHNHINKDLTEEFNQKFKEQEQKYEQKIQSLENKIEQINSCIIEMKKNPIKKIVEKLK